MLKQDLFTSLGKLVSGHADNTPLGIAFSGGGDSTALLSLTLQWLGGQRKLYALIVNHGLRTGSKNEALQAAKMAQELGAVPKILTWQGVKPKTAIQEKARLARYNLLGAQCRALGIETLLLGHNRDDQAETVYMRGQNNSGWRGMAGMRADITAPIWPELYGIRIVRPMLGIRRAEIRAYNHKTGLTYINDPSNENRKFSRIKARDHLKKHPRLRRELNAISHNAAIGLGEENEKIRGWIEAYADIHDWGGISFERDKIANFGSLGPEILRKLALAVSGQGVAAARNKYSQLNVNISASGFQGATLGGAQFVPTGPKLHILRDPGHVLGRSGDGGLGPQPLISGAPLIWDGRFLITTAHKDISAVPLAGFMSQLTKQQKQALKLVPLSARATLPALVRSSTLVASYVHAMSTKYSFESLTHERLTYLSD